MALFIESNTYTQDGIEIIEYSISADEEGGVEYIALENDQDETDSFAIATTVKGEAEVMGEGFLPLEELSRGPHRGFARNAEQGTGGMGISVQLKAGAALSLLVGRIRRGIASIGRNISCKFCKAAVLAIMRAALAFAGVPLPVVGDDLSAAQTAIKAALDALGQGNIGAALQYLIVLMPPSVMDAIKQALHLVNWVWDGIDKITERACSYMRLCPRSAAPPVP
jgi:hypothetical protein